MKELALMIAIFAMSASVFAKDQGENAERPCGAIALIEEYFEIAQIEDSKKAGAKLAAAEAWYLKCADKLLEADRDRIDRERENAKGSLEWPRTIQKAAEAIVAKLSATDRDALKASKKSELIGYHFSLGMAIRNELGLWNGNRALLLSACGGSYCHPDDASMKIIEAVWQRLQGPSLPAAK